MIYALDIGSQIEIYNTIIANCRNGQAVLAPTPPTITCSNLFGTDGGDWVGSLEDQLGIDGNMSADPLLTDAQQHDFSLQEGSPCSADSSICVSAK